MKTIREWVENQYEIETMQDIINHGISGGFSGMTYYTETCAFHDEYENEIWDMLRNDAEEQGLNILELIGTFNGGIHVGSMEQFKNLLAWYAVESVCRLIIDEKENNNE